MSLKDEIEANFDFFTKSWKANLPIAINSLESHNATFVESYSRIVTLNAWKSNLFSSIIPSSNESLLFFAECLNDALVSHVFASFGTWRSSLTALRSCIENCFFFLYYMDHPVELKLWEQKKHKIGFTELYNYFEHHPAFISVNDKSITGLPSIKEEYSTLSRAVHASAKSFRMSLDLHKTSLWNPNVAGLGQWSTREKTTLKNLNLILLCMFRENLKGTSQSSLRKVIRNLFNSVHIGKIKSELGIVIPSA